MRRSSNHSDPAGLRCGVNARQCHRCARSGIYLNSNWHRPRGNGCAQGARSRYQPLRPRSPVGRLRLSSQDSAHPLAHHECSKLVLLVVKLLEQAKMATQARAAQASWGAETMAEGAHALDSDSPFRFLAGGAFNAIKKHNGPMSNIPVNDWLTMGIQREVDHIKSNAQGCLEFLATVDGHTYC